MARLANLELIGAISTARNGSLAANGDTTLWGFLSSTVDAMRNLELVPMATENAQVYEWIVTWNAINKSRSFCTPMRTFVRVQKWWIVTLVLAVAPCLGVDVDTMLKCSSIEVAKLRWRICERISNGVCLGQELSRMFQLHSVLAD